METVPLILLPTRVTGHVKWDHLVLNGSPKINTLHFKNIIAYI